MLKKNENHGELLSVGHYEDYIDKQDDRTPSEMFMSNGKEKAREFKNAGHFEQQSAKSTEREEKGRIWTLRGNAVNFVSCRSESKY